MTESLKIHLMRILDALENIPPFVVEGGRLPDRLKGRCREYSNMLCYTLNKMEHDCVRYQHITNDLEHHYVIVKTGDDKTKDLIIVDWTQPQYFGNRHFRGTFHELVSYTQEALKLPTREKAVEAVRSGYGISNEQELLEAFNKSYEGQQIWLSNNQKNILASPTRLAILPESERNRFGENAVDFNADVLPAIRKHITSGRIVSRKHQPSSTPNSWSL